MWYCNRCGSNKTVSAKSSNPSVYDGWCYNCNSATKLTEDPDAYKEWDEVNKGEETFERREGK